MNKFLPWQLADAKCLLQNPEELPHALLLTGIAGIGKHAFARALATSLLCENPHDVTACGHCASCALIASGNHPDLALVRPEALAALEGQGHPQEDGSSPSGESTVGDATKRKPSSEIRIEQVRALEPWYHRATHRGNWRIVVLYPGEALSVVSANALLKALEEPPTQTLFLLTSDAPDRLLPTILSRCQRFALRIPETAQSIEWLVSQGVAAPEQWLAAAGGAPLAAKELAQTLQTPCPKWAGSLLKRLANRSSPELGSLADELAKSSAQLWLSVMQRLVSDLTLCSFELDARYYPGLSADLQRLGPHIDRRKAVEMAQWINQQSRLAHHPLNGKLFAQACLQRFCDVAS
jgi:DNA polymerase III subunit delta'